ncbi:MAG TPA: CHASE3 domain-containing protein [Hyphomonadaceae bacterium]|nr:CHASE3 domain-containing protein [Hyphomonadaceae bacterium]
MVGDTSSRTAELGRAQRVLDSASQVLGEIRDAETGQRGYLLTLDPAYLDPYRGAATALNVRLDALEASVLPVDRPLVSKVRELAKSKTVELQLTIDLAAGGRTSEARAIVQAGRGKSIMDEIRAALLPLTDRARGRVSANLEATRSNVTFLAIATGLGAVVIVFVAGISLILSVRQIRGLEAAQAEIRSLNEGLEQRVLDRTSALTQANDEIQRFAYIVSHDLRSPLVNVMGFTSEIEAAVAPIEEHFAAPDDGKKLEGAKTALADLPDSLKFIRQATGRMDRLINAILKLAREGRRELVPEPVKLDTLLEGVIGAVQHQVAEAGAEIKLSPTYLDIVSDRIALEQVFGNLVDNAVKYLANGRPGRISLTGRRRFGKVEITVEDNGRGIAPQDLERVFELFRRAGVQDKPGEGIGLAHTRALVRRLGGNITLTSDLGAGTRFIVELPNVLEGSGVG